MFITNFQKATSKSVRSVPKTSLSKVLGLELPVISVSQAHCLKAEEKNLELDWGFKPSLKHAYTSHASHRVVSKQKS